MILKNQLKSKLKLKKKKEKKDLELKVRRRKKKINFSQKYLRINQKKKFLQKK